MRVNKDNIILTNIFILIFSVLLPFAWLVKTEDITSNIRTNSTEIYINKINSYCPEELKENPATKKELYIAIEDKDIRISIEQKMFTHCGAWCLFDYRNPTHGWYWNNPKKQWEFSDEIYHLCPDNEVNYATTRFLRSKRII